MHMAVKQKRHNKLQRRTYAKIAQAKGNNWVAAELGVAPATVQKWRTEFDLTTDVKMDMNSWSSRVEELIWLGWANNELMSEYDNAADSGCPSGCRCADCLERRNRPTLPARPEWEPASASPVPGEPMDEVEVHRIGQKLHDSLCYLDIYDSEEAIWVQDIVSETNLDTIERLVACCPDAPPHLLGALDDARADCLELEQSYAAASNLAASPDAKQRRVGELAVSKLMDGDGLKDATQILYTNIRDALNVIHDAVEQIAEEHGIVSIMLRQDEALPAKVEHFLQRHATA